jgi:hypothetical protein
LVSQFDYTRQFNTLAQYGTYYVNTDEKKANLYRAGLNIHQQERLVHLSSLSYNELMSAAIDQERMMKNIAEADEKKRKMMVPGSAGSGTTWCIPHLGVSCVDHNSSRIGAITHNSNRGNSNSNSRSNSNSSTVLLLHHRSRLPSGHHSSFPPATFHASTARRWATLLENAAYPSKITRHEFRHLWSINRGGIRRVLHHGWAAPTTPPWRRFPR